MTIEKLKKMPGLTLSVKQASMVVGCSERVLRNNLIANPNLFGFPVMIFTTKSGYKKILIPKLPFIKYISTGITIEENGRSEYDDN